MSNPVDDYTQDPYANDVLKTALDGMDSIIDAADNDRAVITEHEFQRYLLPVLTNKSGKQSLRIWYDISGHPMRPIEVVENTTRERLFIIPALMRGILPNIDSNKKRMSIFEILQVAEQKKRVIAHMGERYLIESMRDWEPQGSNDDSVVRQWGAILKRYGVDIGAEEDASVNEESTVEGVDLTGEYDDL